MKDLTQVTQLVNVGFQAPNYYGTSQEGGTRLGSQGGEVEVGKILGK